jgi:hypothetical protein
MKLYHTLRTGQCSVQVLNTNVDNEILQEIVDMQFMSLVWAPYIT